MAWIYSKRRQNRVYFFAEEGGQGILLLARQFVVGDETHTLCTQPRQDFVQECMCLTLNHGAHVAGDDAHLKVGCPAVKFQIGDAGGMLSFQAPDPLAEELIQIATGDTDELEPLEERVALIERFVEDTPVEIQPAQFAVVDGR